uniref:Sodium:solute symporter family protein n=1 Tax=Candidatus Kentrum sp. LFY TaxID=2126342 RepID=A0A450U6N9_9GAMM|nr:MAG: hypothetical protein BECKLFY1418A_GA0070994_100174 [Candidatus Kentron sp. LFY]
MDIFILMASAIVLAIILWKTRGIANYKRTIPGYFWGNKEIDHKVGAHLLWSGSLSLNGLFYHTWLGYQVGIYSLVIQLIWISGFFLMLPFLSKGKLRELAMTDTLHGNIGSKYGRNVQVIAALASIFTFVMLSAWELSVFEGFIASEISSESKFLWLIPAVALFITLLYTIRGGLIFNAKVNAAFGVITLVVLLIAVVIIIWLLGYSYYFDASVTKFNWEIIGKSLG